ncbi:uncharacterized protein METZ01_LOCUS76127, partial [marine metagenome]
MPPPENACASGDTTMNIRHACFVSFAACITVASAWTGSFGAAAQVSAAGVDFQRDVRPILADKCFQCHGPDESSRQAGLRLDIRDSAFEERPRGAAIVPSDVDASLLYQRIAHSDERRRMPPRAADKALSEEEIDVLRRWIVEGASWEQHWAFESIERPVPPVVGQEAWVRNPVDRFVLARLEAEGLSPTPEADRATLARRVALDLTGLPPDPGA